MKVLHLIPGAFHYFDDIKSEAFELMEQLSMWGVDSESSTVTYGAWTQSDESAVQVAAPSRIFLRMNTLEETVESFKLFDVVHLHTPMLGLLPFVLGWKQNNPSAKLIVTYYRPVRISSLFSIYIALYNRYFLPKLFSAADLVAVLDVANIPRTRVDPVLVDSSNTMAEKPLEFAVPYATLSGPQVVAYKYALLYTTLTSQ